MFRDNEASRASAVREAALDGDVGAIAQAALRFWMESAESDREELDADVWNTLVESKALDAAVDGALVALRDRQRLRPAAFICLVEQCEDLELLLELAGLVLDAGWDAHPYLAAVFSRLVELRAEKRVWSFIESRYAELHGNLARWVTVGFTLTTTLVGRRNDLEAWFNGWSKRSDVPMWLMAAYVGTIVMRSPDKPGEWGRLAQHVLTSTVPDVTVSYVVAVAASHAVISDAFTAGIAAIVRERFDDGYLQQPEVDHPIAVYANGARRSRRFLESDLSYLRPEEITMSAVTDLGLGGYVFDDTANARCLLLADLLRHMRGTCERAREFLRLFANLMSLPPGDPRGLDLARQMERSQPGELAGLRPAWKRLVKQRLGLIARIKLGLW